MVSYSLDGITNSNPKMLNGTTPVLAELFPSFHSIAEIRVNEVNNSAEFSGVSDVTTISKGGTNTLHGGLFENLQNSAFNARNTFSATVPKLNPERFRRIFERPFANGEALQRPQPNVLLRHL